MPFELQQVTKVICVNVNPRREFHGPEQVRALDLTFEMEGENTLLDVIEAGLREHHYCNRALDQGQNQIEVLPGIVIPLPNLRFPKLPQSHKYGGTPKHRGYRWTWDWGREERHVDFTDVAFGGIEYETKEGGTCKVKFTVSYNGEELNDNELYGELCGLATMGEVHIQLFAPPELIAVKKGYRAGKPDTPAGKGDGNPNQADLLDDEGDGDSDVDDDQQQDEDTPEKALERAAAGG